MKDKKTLVIILLLIIIIGLLIYIIFNNKQKNTPIIEPTINENVISEEKAKELLKTVYSDTIGVYSNKKVSIDDVNNTNLIVLNIKDYIEKNNISLDKPKDPEANQLPKYFGMGSFEDSGIVVLTKINKSDISLYMKTKYNTNNDFALPASKESFGEDVLDDLTSIVADDNYYYVFWQGRSGHAREVVSKYLKKEEDDNYLYIYDQAVYCTDVFGGGFDYKCYSSMEENSYIADAKDISATEALEKYADKAGNYKHTFRKANGNYYWVSTEPVSKVE